jgi:dTDP-4-dehydrorhamnose 3,5-epimerase
MGSMHFTPMEIPDVFLIEPHVFEDERGFFMESFHQEQFRAAGLPADFVQDNQSGSQQGSLRGLHYQIHQPQGKLVRVIVGEAYDVAVDLRRSSPTFGRWVGASLSAASKHQLWIPPGFAHGFYVLSPRAEVFYKATDYYAPQWERSLLWNDPDLGIAWPLLSVQGVILSDKDRHGAPLAEAEVYD